MTTIEDRLEEALLRAIELTTETHNASSAVAKTACERKLTPDQTRFVATAYNKAKAFALGGMLPDSQRGADFQLADPDEVIKIAFDSEDSEPMPKVASAPFELPDINEFLSERPLLKVAEETLRKEFAGEPSLNDHDMVMAQSRLLKVAGEVTSAKDKLCSALLTKEKCLHTRAKEALSKAADEFVRYPGSRREKVARRIVNGFGEDKGRAALNFISKVASCDVPDVKRTASHAIFPADRIYTCISDAASHAAKSKSVRTLHDELVKQAGPLDDIASSVSYGTMTRGGEGSPFNALLKGSLGSGERNKTLEELLPADIFSRMKGLKSRRAFMDAVMVNPELQEFSLDALENAFNYALETNPETMDSPRLLSNIMLHNINQGNFDDIFSIQAKKDISKDDSATAKTRQELDDLLEARKKSDQKDKQIAKDDARNTSVEAGGFDPLGSVRNPVKRGLKTTGETVGGVLDKLMDKAKESKESRRQAKGKLSQKALDEVREKVEEQKQVQADTEAKQIEEENREQAILDELGDKSTGRVGRDVDTGRLSQRVGPEDIPVRIGGQKTYLDRQTIAQLAKAYEDRTLSDEGQKFYEPFKGVIKTLSEGISWPEGRSKEPVISNEIRKRDAFSDARKGLDTGVSDLSELFIPNPNP